MRPRGGFRRRADEHPLLIDESDPDQSGAETQERQSAEEAFEARQIEQKHFQRRREDQKGGRPTRLAQAAPDAIAEQRQAQRQPDRRIGVPFAIAGAVIDSDRRASETSNRSGRGHSRPNVAPPRLRKVCVRGRGLQKKRDRPERQRREAEQSEEQVIHRAPRASAAMRISLADRPARLGRSASVCQTECASVHGELRGSDASIPGRAASKSAKVMPTSSR